MDKIFSADSIFGVVKATATKNKAALYCHGLGHAVEAGELLAGADSSGAVSLMVPLLSHEDVAEDLTGSALSLGQTVVQGKSFLKVTCLDANLFDVFLMYVRDLVTGLPQRGETGSFVLRHLQRWRNLFMTAANNPSLELPQIAGLLAELIVLERLVRLDPARNVAIWTGPSQASHDFKAKGHALEVKSTLAREGLRVRINGVEQLNTPPGVTLHLGLIRFSREPKGETLPSVVQRIRSLNVNGNAFDQLLLQAGYRERDKEHYDDYPLMITEELLFDVLIDQFPRIVPGSFLKGSVPDATESINYTIDLAGIKSTALSDEAIQLVFEEIVNDKDAGLDS